ncbi:hypothetical protein Tco_0070645 [Tanacetum coccineum]
MIIFFWVDEFVVPANARFSWFSGSNIVKDRAPAPSEYNVEHINTLYYIFIAQASRSLGMEFECFIATADPRKVRIVERPIAENERPIITVAKHHTVTLLPTSVVRSSGELSASVERSFFVGDAVLAMMKIRDCPVAFQPPKKIKAIIDYCGSVLEVSLLEFLTATTVATIATMVAIPADVSKDKSAPHPFIFGSSSSSEKTDRTLSLFTGRSGSGFDAVGFELNDGRLCANMIDHFTPPAFFKTVRGMEHEQLFTEFNVSAARNLSLSSEVRMRVEYNILEKRKWRSIAEEKNVLLEVKDKEIEDLKSQLLKAKEESTEVIQLRAQVSGLEATENSLRGEVASAKDHNVLLEQECNSLKLKVTGLESTIAEKDHELSDLGASSSSLKSQNQSLVNQVHELEISSADLREKLEMYEGSLKQLEEFQDNLMGPLRTRLAEIDADFTRCCMRFQESFHPHLLNVVAGRRWLLTHGMKLLVVKCLNSNEYMEALGHAFGRAIEKGMQEGLAAGIEHGQAGRCLTDLEAYIPSAEDDFNSAIRDLCDLNFPLLQELSNKKDASTWDIMDLLRLDDAVAETLGMTDFQPDVSQLMVPVHHKQDRVVIGSQALSVALDICRGRVEKMERNLIERLPFLKDVFVSIDDPLSAEALIEPPAEVPATNVLSSVVIVPHTDPSVSVEDYDNPDSADAVPENATLGSESEGKIDASAGGGLTFSQLDDEARDAVL